MEERMSRAGDGSHEYSDSSFWDKVTRFAAAAGRAVLYPALLLYYAMQRPETPAWAKAVIVGALAYFISPVDAIPDVIPVAGYTDDAGVLAAAIGTVAAYIDDGVKAKARATVDRLLG
jgi:uncharacterized membrane protein YkvA (DUF1232 family)